MTDQTPAPGNASGLPSDVLDRLALFAEWTYTEAPSLLLDKRGAPTDELLAYSEAQGLSLDWLFKNDPRGLVMRVHNATRHPLKNCEAMCDVAHDKIMLCSITHDALLLHSLAKVVLLLDDGMNESRDMLHAQIGVVQERAAALYERLDALAHIDD